MEELVTIVKKSLYHADVTPRDKLVLGLSGGRDSVCLAFCLQKLQQEMGFLLVAVHVHHGIRKEAADRDAAFCESLCTKWHIPFVLKRVESVSLAEREHLSLEDAARRLRHQALQEEAGDGYIVLAHHQEDQAETLLLHLLRGSGLKGLTGMAEQQGQLLRPLLQVRRQEIDAFVRDHQLPFVEDETNQDTTYTRNRIRLDLLPNLKENYNPNIIKTLVHTADILREDAAYLEKLARLRYRTGMETYLKNLGQGKAAAELNRDKENEHEAPVFPLSLLTGERAMDIRLLDLWLEDLGVQQDISYDHHLALLALCQGPTGKRLSLPHGLTVQKSYDILTCIPEKSTLQVVFFTYESEELTKEEFLQRFPEFPHMPNLLTEAYMDREKVSQTAEFRHRLPGDRILLKAGRQKLKDLLINEKRPRKERDVLWLLADGSEVLWIVGGRMAESVKVTDGTETIVHYWVSSPENKA